MKKRREAGCYTSPRATVIHTVNRFRTTAYNDGEPEQNKYSVKEKEGV